ncbi:MAG: inorganic diphosphatase [Candidatus Moranbacteria bacterium]|nr:inorganic diphosphatase [Candidatus Moranbacteria bacterium]
MKIVIEMPKGDTRRRHLKYNKTGFIDLGPIRDAIPVNDGVMPVHYGYIPGTLNWKDDDEVDALVLSSKEFGIGQEIEARPIALIRRSDGDDKIVAADETQEAIQDWSDIAEDMRQLIEAFFSYHHTILSIENADVARKYVEDNHISA